MMLSRYMVLGLRRVGLLPYFTFHAPFRLSGKRTSVPLVKGQGLLNVVEFEPFMDVLIRKLVPLFPGVFVDVGVNVAQTLIKAKNIFPELEYIGFEPNPTCVAYAQRVVRANRYTRVRLVQAGLTEQDGEGTLTLWQGGADDPTGTLMHDFRPATKEQRTITVPLISWARAEEQGAIGRLGFVKIDVEGGELFVLRAMQARLRSDRPVVAIEVLPSHEPPKPERLERQTAIEALARELDLVIHRIHKDGDRITLTRIEHFGVHHRIEWIDHLLVPKEREQEVVAAFA